MAAGVEEDKAREQGGVEVVDKAREGRVATVVKLTQAEGRRLCPP